MTSLNKKDKGTAGQDRITVAPQRDAYVGTNQYFFQGTHVPYFYERDLLKPVGDLASLPPSQLLAATNRAIPFNHRDAEVGSLIEWRDSECKASAYLMHAPGGQGKTRLADYLLSVSRQDGWSAHAARHATETAYRAPEQASEIEAGNPNLVIIDYADRWPLDDLLELITELQAVCLNNIRVLLLARSAGWWPTLRHRLSKQGWDTKQHQLESIEPTETKRIEIYLEARTRFAQILAGADGLPLTLSPDLSSPQYSLALSIHMAALADTLSAITEDPAPGNLTEASAYILDRERAAWDRLRRVGQISCNYRTMSRAVFTSILAGPTSYQDGVGLLDLTGVTTPTEPPNTVIDDHGVCYPNLDQSMVLQPLYPDRLAEDFIALQVPNSPYTAFEVDPWSDSAIHRLLEPDGNLPRETTQRVLLTLIEAGRRWPHIANKFVFETFSAQPSFALSLGGSGLLRLVTMPNINTDLLLAIDAVLPSNQRIEFNAARALIGTLLFPTRVEQTDDPVELAQLYAELGFRMGDAGDFDGALKMGGEAVKCLQGLDYNDGRGFIAAARHLLNLSGTLAQQEHFDDAKQIAQGAVSLYRVIAKAAPEAFDSQLAAALNNLGMAMIKCGDTEMAAEALNEAILIRRRIAAAAPDKHEQDLAASLDNLGILYTELGKHQEALDATIEATNIFRRLVESGRHDLDHELAAALDNLGGCLWQVGKRAEAVEAIAESVEYFKRLADFNSIAFKPELSKALANLASKYWKLDRKTESIEHLEESIRSLDGLVQRYSARFLWDSRRKHLRLGEHLMEVADFVSAAAVLQDAVVLYETGEDSQSDDAISGKAFTLNKLSECLAEIPDEAGALSASEASVQAWDGLASAKIHDVLNSAISYKNLAVRYGQGGRHVDAVAAASTAISIFRGQSARDAYVAFEYGLALGVYAMACEDSRSNLEDALSATEEVLGIFLALRDQGEAETSEYMFAALVTQVKLLQLLGRDQEAEEIGSRLDEAIGRDWRT